MSELKRNVNLPQQKVLVTPEKRPVAGDLLHGCNKVIYDLDIILAHVRSGDLLEITNLSRPWEFGPFVVVSHG